MIEKLTPQEFVGYINEASATMESFQKDYKMVASDLEKLLPVLQSCNESLADKKFSLDPQMNQAIDRFLKAMQFFQAPGQLPSRPDISTQAKVAGLQASLISACVEQLKAFRDNLRKRGWKVGERAGDKVASTSESKQSSK